MMKLYLNFGLVTAVLLAASIVQADSLELKNGSLIKGKFTGGTEREISFRVGSSVQKYNLADIVALRFDSERAPDMPTRPTSSFPEGPAAEARAKTVRYITIPAGTRISVRTIDRIDSIKNHLGDRFEASLEEPLTADDNIVVAKGADVYGRLAESKKSGTFTGRSELQLELTGIVVNGQTIPLVTGEYELTGKSRGASTAKRTIGGAAVGSIVGALAVTQNPKTVPRETRGILGRTVLERRKDDAKEGAHGRADRGGFAAGRSGREGGRDLSESGNQ